MAEQPIEHNWVNKLDNEFEAAGGTTYVRRLIDIKNAAHGSALATDWAAWRNLVISSTFDGLGDHIGLTAMSGHLVDCICTCVHNKNEPLIRRWLARISLILQELGGLGVPPLNPLVELQSGLGWVLSTLHSADDRIRNAHVESIRPRWFASRDSVISKLMTALATLERKPILVVGHSGIVLAAYNRLMAERNLTLDLSFCCPNPDRSSSDPLAEGRRPQGGSPYGGKVKLITRENAEGLIRAKRFERIFCSACAYTEDKKSVWVTHGAMELAAAAAQSNTTLQPIGGEYKQIKFDWDTSTRCEVADCISHFDGGLLA